MMSPTSVPVAVISDAQSGMPSSPAASAHTWSSGYVAFRTVIPSSHAARQSTSSSSSQQVPSSPYVARRAAEGCPTDSTHARYSSHWPRSGVPEHPPSATVAIRNPKAFNSVLTVPPVSIGPSRTLVSKGAASKRLVDHQQPPLAQLLQRLLQPAVRLGLHQLCDQRRAGTQRMLYEDGRGAYQLSLIENQDGTLSVTGESDGADQLRIEFDDYVPGSPVRELIHQQGLAARGAGLGRFGAAGDLSGAVTALSFSPKWRQVGPCNRPAPPLLRDRDHEYYAPARIRTEGRADRVMTRARGHLVGDRWPPSPPLNTPRTCTSS